MQLGTKTNYKEVEEKLLGLFWYINKLVPSCTEATVLLNVYPDFVSKFDFNIRQHSIVEHYPKYFCCLVRVSYHGFNKKCRGTDIFGLCFVNIWLSLYFVARKII